MSFEHRVSRIRERRERRDHSQLQDGLDAFRIETKYRGSNIARAAQEANIARSTLYERRAVWGFYWQTSERTGERYSAWRIMRLYPHLSYTHLRDAIELEDIDDAITAFEAAADGDERFPELSRNLPMTPEAFQVYIAKLLNKTTPPAPIADVQGLAGDVIAEFLQRIQSEPGWRDKRMRLIAVLSK